MATGFARVAELADAYGSGPYGETRGGSSPLAESLLRPAGVSPPFLDEGAAFVPPDFLLAAQRAFISSDSFLRPAAVSAPFFLTGAGFVPPFSFAQRALAADESFARVEGEK